MVKGGIKDKGEALSSTVNPPNKHGVRWTDLGVLIEKCAYWCIDVIQFWLSELCNCPNLVCIITLKCIFMVWTKSFRRKTVKNTFPECILLANFDEKLLGTWESPSKWPVKHTFVCLWISTIRLGRPCICLFGNCAYWALIFLSTNSVAQNLRAYLQDVLIERVLIGRVHCNRLCAQTKKNLYQSLDFDAVLLIVLTRFPRLPWSLIELSPDALRFGQRIGWLATFKALQSSAF